MCRNVFIIMAAFLALASRAAAQAPDANAQLFGQLPVVEAAALSPNGKRLALVQHKDGKTLLQIRYPDHRPGRSLTVDVSGNKIRELLWASNRHVLLRVSRTVQHEKFVANKFEYVTVLSFDTRRKKLVQLLVRANELAANASLGKVSGRVPGKDMVLMPAYRQQGTMGRQYTLFRVRLDTGQGNVMVTGSGTATDKFITDETGQVRARVDYDETAQQFRVLAYRDRYWEEIYRSPPRQLSLGVTGIMPDGKSLALIDYGQRDTAGMYLMSLQDGTITGPLFSQPSSDIQTVLWQFARNQQVAGVGFAHVGGAQYRFITEPMQTSWQKIMAKLPGVAVQPVSWSTDARVWLLLVHDGSMAGQYMLYRPDRDALMPVANVRPDIPAQLVGSQSVIHYNSTDGTPISAVLTMPPGFVKGTPIPMVVLPHGGPASHSSLGWNWMAQYLANEGYLVLEPNYRGSSGFGVALERGGDGKWNDEVLDDINLGAHAMVNAGLADPARICIAGVSFGGYAALAASTFKPDPYQCAVSIAGVSDWPEYLKHTDEIRGLNNRVTDIWEVRLRDENGEMDLDGLSPARHAGLTRVPVLLIHGRDDSIVPIAQSRRMKRALERSGKPVELVELNGEDHWLSRQETRVETLSAMGAFLRNHLKPVAK